MLSHDSSDFELTIRQQPDRARVAGGKEKGMCVLCYFILRSSLASAVPCESAARSWSRGRRPEAQNS